MSTIQTAPAGADRSPVQPRTSQPRWTRGRLAALVVAVLGILSSAAMFVGALILDNADHEHRDGRYFTSDPTTLETSGHALSIEEVDLDGLHGDWLLGDVRLQVAPTDRDVPIFVGIATTRDAEKYLSGVAHSTVDEISDPRTRYTDHRGGAPSVRPADAGIWVAQSTGSGNQDVSWSPQDGSWTVVVMNADGSRDVRVTGDVGATLPLIGAMVRGLGVGGLVAGILGLGTASWLGISLGRSSSRP
jgi:hypothetical protein